MSLPSWLDDVPLPPPPFTTSRPAPDTLVVRVRSGGFLAALFGSGVEFTLDRAALRIRLSASLSTAIRWDQVVSIDLSSEPFGEDETDSYIFGPARTQGPIPHVALQLHPDAGRSGIVRLGAGFDDAALRWLLAALRTAWKRSATTDHGRRD